MNLAVSDSVRRRVVELLRIALLRSVLARLRETIVAAAAVFVKEFLRRALSSLSIICSQMCKIVAVALLLIIVRGTVVDALVVTMMMVHHCVIEMLLLMKSIFVVAVR